VKAVTENDTGENDVRKTL